MPYSIAAIPQHYIHRECVAKNRGQQNANSDEYVQGGPVVNAGQCNGKRITSGGEDWIKVPINPPQKSGDTLLKKYSTKDMTRKA